MQAKIDDLTWQLDLSKTAITEANEKLWGLSAKIEEDKEKVENIDRNRADFLHEIQSLRKELKFFEEGKQNQIKLLKEQYQDEIANIILEKTANKYQ